MIPIKDIIGNHGNLRKSGVSHFHENSTLTLFLASPIIFIRDLNESYGSLFNQISTISHFSQLHHPLALLFHDASWLIFLYLCIYRLQPPHHSLTSRSVPHNTLVDFHQSPWGFHSFFMCFLLWLLCFSFFFLKIDLWG